MIISNAIVYSLVSMGRIDGRQSASETLEDLWSTVLPHIPENEHSVDACVVTTMGLYANTSGHKRPEQRRQLNRFQKNLLRYMAMARVKDPRINPRALQTSEWDLLIHQSNALDDLVTAYGKLKHLHSHCKGYKAALKNLCNIYGREDSDESLAFFHEEFAVLYLLAAREISFRRNAHSLRWDDSGTIYFSYPGPIPYAEALAFNCLHGRRKFPRGKVIYIDTTERECPDYTDFADIIGQFDSSTNHAAFI